MSLGFGSPGGGVEHDGNDGMKTRKREDDMSGLLILSGTFDWHQVF